MSKPVDWEARAKAAEALLKEWQECALYDATMEGPIFKGWNRSALERCRLAARQTKDSANA